MTLAGRRPTVTYMIRVSRKTPVQDTAEKARRIVAAGNSTMFVGDPRHLRRAREALAADPGVETFLGDDGEDVVLVVQPVGREGGLYSEKVPAVARERGTKPETIFPE